MDEQAQDDVGKLIDELENLFRLCYYREARRALEAFVDAKTGELRDRLGDMTGYWTEANNKLAAARIGTVGYQEAIARAEQRELAVAAELNEVIEDLKGAKHVLQDIARTECFCGEYDEGECPSCMAREVVGASQ